MTPNIRPIPLKSMFICHRDDKGRPHGKLIRYAPNGEVSCKGTNHHGIRIGLWLWYKRTKPIYKEYHII